MPSTSATRRINQEETLHVPSDLEPILEHTQTQQEPRIELEPMVKTDTPLKRKRLQDDDLRSPVCTPNSSVKVCNGPWDRHIRNHKSSHGLCNKCTWGQQPKVLVSTNASGLIQRSPHLVASSARQHARLPIWGGGGGLKGLLLGGTPIASCRGVPAPVRDTLRNWRFAAEQLQTPYTDCGP